ncbi:MAG: DNA repair protein RadA [Gammaproteobacteria bacterium]|nr:DNA repair protein RadA [Gammaproteobacteria bacterium]MBT8149783.1 DNA repair protein RadA [Gammaproteobacteria bacterium]NND38211.1 DNA repair protein RadA [Pseudomonadales bacterium]NNL11167.1 DNA repair protein RadA [Pseudomonadales bacterium]NNM10817.1 DNA repair protein RadA [Pseudomonadales bacterium]
MPKTKTAYVCSDCGSDYSKWQGQCADCGAWNTLSELRLGAVGAGKPRDVGYAGAQAVVASLKTIGLEETRRIETGLAEFDRVLGGGLVPGSAVLIGGQPGAGKSTLLLQVTSKVAAQHNTLYVTGEESLQQVALRARRLGLSPDSLQLMAETSVESVLKAAATHNPRIIVIDSIQVMHTDTLQAAAGSVSQVRECAAAITRFAKQTETVVLLVGHVTKDGSLAGPKVLEHMIDCSLLLEGAADNRFRTLRGQKNRFGAANELGVFAMTEQGMREVKNPSAIFLSGAAADSPGSCVAVLWEGSRALLVEIQALVDESQASNPRRVAVGLEQNRLAMLLAVLHRHGGVAVGAADVFANAVGGVKVLETGVDLALLLAVVSSFRDSSLPQGLVVFGEVGLSGELRPVPGGQERIAEAAKHGFTRAIVPFANQPKQAISGIKVEAVKWLREALELI